MLAAARSEVMMDSLDELVASTSSPDASPRRRSGCSGDALSRLLESSVPEVGMPEKSRLSLQVRLRNAYHENLMKVMSVMQRYDSDGSGSIELTEFVMMVRELTGSPFAHDAEVHGLFKQLDKDNSGAASFTELCEFMSRKTLATLGKMVERAVGAAYPASGSSLRVGRRSGELPGSKDAPG
jgi:hypothetical protein